MGGVDREVKKYKEMLNQKLIESNTMAASSKDSKVQNVGVQTSDDALGVVSEYDASTRVMSKRPLQSVEYPESIISRPHTITWLFGVMAVVFTWSLTAPPMTKWWQSACGFGVAALIFLTFAGVHFPDGILIRPFPAYVFSISTFFLT